MHTLPKKLRLTYHAVNRLKERKDINKHYNIEDIMKTYNCKWYTIDDMIEQSALYTHALYVCRKSKDFDYLTDGDIELLYNKGTGVVITVIELKEKFKPITQYIKA